MGLVSFGQISRNRGRPHQPFLHGQWMPCNCVADSIYTKKCCSRLSSSEVHFSTENGHFVFWATCRGLRSTVYTVHFRLNERS